MHYPDDVTLTMSKLPMMPFFSLTGQWTETTAGGTLDGIEWRSNPQFLLKVSPPSSPPNSPSLVPTTASGHLSSSAPTVRLQIFLAQHTLVNKQMHHIGFYVVKVDQKAEHKKILSVGSEQLVVKEQAWCKSPEGTEICEPC